MLQSARLVIINVADKRAFRSFRRSQRRALRATRIEKIRDSAKKKNPRDNESGRLGFLIRRSAGKGASVAREHNDSIAASILLVTGSQLFIVDQVVWSSVSRDCKISFFATSPRSSSVKCINNAIKRPPIVYLFNFV